jgi:hypothetical protein
VNGRFVLSFKGSKYALELILKLEADLKLSHTILPNEKVAIPTIELKKSVKENKSLLTQIFFCS